MTAANKHHKNKQDLNRYSIVSDAAFTHAGLTTRHQTESLNKSIFVLSRSRDIDLCL